MSRDIILVVPLWVVITIPCILGLLIGFWFQNVAHTWHRALIKPYFYPHLPTFIAAWLICYGLLEYSFVLLTAYNTEQNPGDIQSLATISLTLYWFVISFNLIWFFIFFIQKYLFITFLLNVIQCGIIVGLISFSFRLDRVIGYLILPLLVWSIFSIYLGFGVWLFNRDGVVIDLENANRRRSPRDRERLNGSQNRNYDSIGETV